MDESVQKLMIMNWKYSHRFQVSVALAACNELKARSNVLRPLPRRTLC